MSAPDNASNAGTAQCFSALDPMPRTPAADAISFCGELSRLNLPDVANGSAASPMTTLIREGVDLVGQLPAIEGDALMNALLRGKSPAANALRSRVSSPQVTDKHQGGSLRDLQQQVSSPTQPFDRLVVEAEELVQHLPDQHAMELLRTIERGSTPVAKALRSRACTPALEQQVQNSHQAMQEEKVDVPVLDIGQAQSDSAATSIFGVLTERSKGALELLEAEGKDLYQKLGWESQGEIARSLASLSGDNPVALRLFSGLVEVGLVVGSEIEECEPFGDGEILRHCEDDANAILLAVQRATAPGAGVEDKSSVLTTLQGMVFNDGSFVAWLLYLDLMVECRSLGENKGLDDRSREQCADLIAQGADLIQNIEESLARSIMDSIHVGATSYSPLASLLYLHLLLKVEVDPENPRFQLRMLLKKCRTALQSLLTQINVLGESDGNASTAWTPSQERPRQRIQDKRSAGERAVDYCVESVLQAFVSSMLLQEVAELCHQELRSHITRLLRRVVESKGAVRELQELILNEERASQRIESDHADDDMVNESSSAPADTFYTFKLCEQGDMDTVIGSVRLEATTTWAEFREAVKDQLGYALSCIRYDDDFGPKQAKDIFCSSKTEWKELREMMEEDKGEIQDVLTVEVFKEVEHKPPARFLVKSEFGGEGAAVGVEDLNELLKAYSADLQAAQKTLIECKGKLKASWKHYSANESNSFQYLQGTMRRTAIRRKFCCSRELVLFAAHIFRPLILRHYLSLRWKLRHTISALKIQCSFRSRKARKLAYVATIDKTATAILSEVAMGFICSVSEEYRAVHKEWIIVDATNASLDIQRIIRFRLSPTRETIIAQFDKEDKASYPIVRFFRAVRRRKTFFRSAIATVTTETILFGRPMEHAFTELLKRGKVRYMQALLRRSAVQLAMSGHVTSASSELATTWAFQDAVIWVLQSQDDVYKEPRRLLASCWLQTRTRRYAVRQIHVDRYVLALTFYKMFQRRQDHVHWRAQYDSIKTLDACIKRQAKRGRHVKLWVSASKVQNRVKSMRLIFSTRKFKKLMDRLVDIARANLYRRFYVHSLLVAEHQTSCLRDLAAKADHELNLAAAAKREDARRRAEEEMRAAEGASVRRRRAEEAKLAAEAAAGSMHSVGEVVTRVSSVEKCKQKWKEQQALRVVSQEPKDRIFQRSLQEAMQVTTELVCLFVDQQSRRPKEASQEAQAEVDTEKSKEDWFRSFDTCSESLREFCKVQVDACENKKKNETADAIASNELDALNLHQDIVFWLQGHVDDIVERWQECQSDAFTTLRVAGFLLNVWMRKSWIRNPGFLSLEVDGLSSFFDTFMVMLHRASIRLETMLNQFPNIDVSVAIMQCWQETCADEIQTSKQGKSLLKRQQGYFDLLEKEGDVSFITRVNVISSWLNEQQEAIIRQTADTFHSSTRSSFWAGMWTDLLQYLYRAGHLDAILPIPLEEFKEYIELYAQEFNYNYGPVETPFHTYDNVWTLIYAGQDDYMDTTKQFTWTPEGYALNASSGELVPVEVPDTKAIKSRFGAVNSLSWKMEKKMSDKIKKGMRHIHPVGFLGALSVRRRNDRVHMWTAISIETSVCNFLNFSIRITTGRDLITVLRVFTILSLRPGRGTLLYQAGCVELLSSKIVGSGASDEIELSSAAAFALQSLLYDAYVSSQVSVDAVLQMAEHLKHPVNGTMHVSIIYCLQLIIRNNKECQMELARQSWLHGILLKLLRLKDGPEGLTAAVAMLIAMLSYDSEVALLLGKDPETISALISMLRDATDIVSRQSALTALSSLGINQINVDTMIQHSAFHDTLMGVLATQSVQLFPLSASLAVKFVKNPAMCNKTMQYPKVLNALLSSMTFSDSRISVPATEVLMAMTSSIEKAWLLVNSSRQPDLKDLQNLVMSAGQVEQFGVNSFAMSTICNGMISGYPKAKPCSARALRSILRCSITACDWVLGNEEAMHTIIDGIGHRNESIQEQCIWCIHDLSARNKGAAALVKRGGFVRLKILLYTDCRSESKVAAIRSLKHFLLGLDRVAGPDEELIRRLTELLRSDNESLQDACADILSRMIQQDYIDLFINVHGAQCCPQSDNWGYCDPFVKMMINGQEHQTPILRNTLCPVWNYECKFTISDKSDSLLVELYDWDNTGAEVLGQIELSCERLHELGTELGLYRVGRDLSEKAKFVKDDAENKSTNLVVEAERQSEESRKAANEEAEKVRDELLEEARFIGSDAKAEAKKIVDDAAAKAKEIINAAAGQPRTVEFRAEQQGAKIREAAKKKAAQVQKVWDESTKDIEDIPERIKLLKQQAESKYVRIRKEAGEEADRKLLMAKKEAFKLRVDAHDESERILSLKEGWHIVMERNRDQLTGEELMGFRGEVAGFDDNGKVTGPGGKKLEPAPTVLKINFEYCVNVNVDAIIYDQQWITPRLFELLALENRRELRQNILVIMRALTEDVKESRVSFGEYPGGLDLFCHIFDTPGLDSCYAEICKMLRLLLLVPENRMPVYKSPLMNHLKSLRKWKGSEVAVIASENVNKLEKHAERMRRIEKEKKKEDRQKNAAVKHKKSPTSSPLSPLSPHDDIGSPLNAEEDKRQRSRHKIETIWNHHGEQRNEGKKSAKDMKSQESQPVDTVGPVLPYKKTVTEDEDEENHLYDPDYEWTS